MQSIPTHQLKVAIQNELAAESLKNSKLFNSACSRYYYYVFQHLVVIHRELMPSKKAVPSTLGHLFTMDSITNDISNRLRSQEKALTLNKDFLILKKIRTQADYGQVLLDEEISVRARTIAKRIILGLKTVYPFN